MRCGSETLKEPDEAGQCKAVRWCTNTNDQARMDIRFGFGLDPQL